jgi:hypothetical protein
MKNWMLAFRERIAKNIVDGILDNADRDDYSSENQEPGAGIFIAAVLINICVAFSDSLTCQIIACMWPVMGLMHLHYELMADARTYNSTKWTELLIAMKVDSNLFSCVYLWPFRMVLRLCDWGHVTFRDQLEDQTYRRKYRRIAGTCGHDSAIDAIRYCSKNEIKASEIESERARRIPQDIAIGAKTSYACGATAVTLVTTPALAQETPKATNAIEMSSYGWVAGVAQRPIENKGVRENQLDLRHARLRTTVTAKPLNLGLYTEMDGALLQEPRQDWLKQYYLTWKPADHVTLNAGRMATAPVWMSPPPFLHEPVNYPRTPYPVFAYALEADVRRGSWRAIADVTGKSGLKFSDEEQFSRLEGAFRVEYAATKKLTVAITAQASDEFIRSSFDFTLKPAGWMDVRGAVYTARNEVPETSTATTTDGSYLFTAVRPLSRFPALDLHGQVDYLQTRHAPRAAPWALTGGARILLNNGKQSVTADYQHVPGVDGGKDTGTLLVRLQTRF